MIFVSEDDCLCSVLLILFLIELETEVSICVFLEKD